MTTRPNQSMGGTNQDKTAQPNQSQKPHQPDQNQEPQDQQQQDAGNQQEKQGHPPGLTQGDNPDRQSRN